MRYFTISSQNNKSLSPINFLKPQKTSFCGIWKRMKKFLLKFLKNLTQKIDTINKLFGAN